MSALNVRVGHPKGQLMVTKPASVESAECSFCRADAVARIMRVTRDHGEILMDLCVDCGEDIAQDLRDLIDEV